MAWAARCETNHELNEQKLARPEDLRKGMKAPRDLLEALEENAIIPHYYSVKGSAADKLPLSLYLYDSGPEEHEWVTRLILGNRS